MWRQGARRLAPRKIATLHLRREISPTGTPKTKAVKKHLGMAKTERVVYHLRPSFGLWLWGPLVPAGDCRPGLYLLTALQTTAAMALFWRSRRVRRPWLFGAFGAGAYLTFQLGLEIAHLSLPYDPYYEDAAAARASATASGETPSRWFGPLRWKPIGYPEFSTRIDAWVEAQEERHMFQHVVDSLQHEGASQHHAVWQQLRADNAAVEQLVLNHTLPYSAPSPLSTAFLPPPLSLRNFVPATSEDLELVWDQVDPWSDPSAVGISLRFIPHSTSTGNKST